MPEVTKTRIAVAALVAAAIAAPSASARPSDSAVPARASAAQRPRTTRPAGRGSLERLRLG